VVEEGAVLVGTAAVVVGACVVVGMIVVLVAAVVVISALLPHAEKTSSRATAPVYLLTV